MLNKAQDVGQIISKKPKIVNKEFLHFESKKVPEETHIGPWRGLERNWIALASQSECSTQIVTDQSNRTYNPGIRALHRNVNKLKSYISWRSDKGVIHSSAADERTSSPLSESRKRRSQKRIRMASTKQTDRKPRAP